MSDHAFIDGLLAALVQKKVVSASEAANFKAAFSESTHDDFTTFLYQEGFVDKEQLLVALGDYYQVPYFDVEGYFFDHLLLRDFPKDFLLRNSIIPLEIDQTILIMIAGDPSNQELLPLINKYAPYDIQLYVGLAPDIQDAVKEFYEKSLTEPDDMMDDNEEILEELEMDDLEHLEDEEEPFE